MSAENVFKINQRLEIMLTKHETADSYSSRIEEIIDGHLILAMPMKKGSPILYSRGTAFYGKLFTESGVYSFKSTFMDKKMSPLPIWIVTMPTELKKTQQRSFVRFDVALPVVVDYLADKEKEDITTLNLFTKDLSAGGLQFICSHRIRIGTDVNLALDIPDNGLFNLEGAVVRVIQPLPDRQMFWIGIKFSDVPNNIRDKITKYIIKKQLEQRQRGR